MQWLRKWAAWIIGGTVVIGAVIGGFLYWGSLSSVQTRYYGIVVDEDGKAEVLYKLGVPTSVTDYFDGSDSHNDYHLDAQPGDPHALPAGRNFRNFDEWSYTPDGQSSTVTVKFRKSNGKVREVECFSDEPTPGLCRPLLGINIGDSEARVTERLGSPTDTVDNGPGRVMMYRKLNVVVTFVKLRVVGLVVGSLEQGD